MPVDMCVLAQQFSVPYLEISPDVSVLKLLPAAHVKSSELGVGGHRAAVITNPCYISGSAFSMLCPGTQPSHNTNGFHACGVQGSYGRVICGVTFARSNKQHTLHIMEASHYNPSVRACELVACNRAIRTAVYGSTKVEIVLDVVSANVHVRLVRPVSDEGVVEVEVQRRRWGWVGVSGWVNAYFVEPGAVGSDKEECAASKRLAADGVDFCCLVDDTFMRGCDIEQGRVPRHGSPGRRCATHVQPGSFAVAACNVVEVACVCGVACYACNDSKGAHAVGRGDMCDYRANPKWGVV